MTEALIAILALAAGAAVGYIARQQAATKDAAGAEAKAREMLSKAEADAREMVANASTGSQAEIDSARAAAETEIASLREDLTGRERAIAEQEGSVERRQAEASAEREKAIARSEEAERRIADLDEERTLLDQAAAVQRRELERLAQMTAQEARDALTAGVIDEAKRHAMSSVREIEQRAREEGEQRARKIVTIAIQRVASQQTTESSVTVFPLPSEDMKGRIIGKEGRNIRAFEATTGVTLLVDDTPETVVLSTFDPVRRAVGRLTLEKLVGDGRIQPARIEEMHEVAQGEIEEEIKRAGEAALLEVGITDAHPEMVKVLGRLQYRTSYGQNVLKHSVEAAFIAAAIASELGVDPTLPKRGAMMHDIGKALTHEVEGSHAIIGAELARRLKEPPEVVHAIEAHHNEVQPTTIEAVLTQVADQISGGRPGARRESLETYVKRLEKLEEIATAHAGVGKVFAMQAGREVWVMVEPEQVDDLASQVLARDIAKQVEEELQYPGQIKITVVRESRSVEFAK